MRYVVGAGVSGLLYALYHSDHTIVTDQVGRAVTGADPLIWLNVTPHTHRLLVDVGMAGQAAMVEKPIGYRTVLGIEPSRGLSDRERDTIFLKKMVPWPMIHMGGYIGADIRVQVPRRQFTKDSDVIRYWGVDLRALLDRVLERVGRRIWYGRVTTVYDDEIVVRFEGTDTVAPYEHLVSTVPAPLFARLYAGTARWSPRFHYAPVTFAISETPPPWWDDRYAIIYDADLGSPISRVGRFGDQWRYEVTGWMSAEELEPLRPVRDGVFAHPYGRIYQDFELRPPNDRIEFLGRAARWDYRGLIDVELEIIHGRMADAEKRQPAPSGQDEHAALRGDAADAVRGLARRDQGAAHQLSEPAHARAGAASDEEGDVGDDGRGDLGAGRSRGSQPRR